MLNSEINKLKYAVKNQTGVTMRITMKMFDVNKLLHWQQDKKTKLRNAFENNMAADIKPSKTQISKFIQYAGFLG